MFTTLRWPGLGERGLQQAVHGLALRRRRAPRTTEPRRASAACSASRCAPRSSNGSTSFARCAGVHAGDERLGRGPHLREGAAGQGEDRRAASAKRNRAAWLVKRRASRRSYAHAPRHRSPRHRRAHARRGRVVGGVAPRRGARGRRQARRSWARTTGCWRSGRAAYLEVIAIDPDAPPPARARWFALDAPAMRARLERGPALIHWVASTDDIEDAAARVARGRWARSSRPRAATTAGASPFRATGACRPAGVFPTLIQWEGQRPAAALPDSGCRLESLDLGHPRASAHPRVAAQPRTRRRGTGRYRRCGAGHRRANPHAGRHRRPGLSSERMARRAAVG